MAKNILKCAISYSHDDMNLCEIFKKHLVVLSKVFPLEVWCDMKILAGKDIDEEIKENFNKSDIIFLLVSNSFVSSSYCFETELNMALERHKAKQSVVIPVILSEVEAIDKLPFGKLKRAPQDGQPIRSFRSFEAGFTNADGIIREVLENFAEYKLKGAKAATTVPQKRDKDTHHTTNNRTNPKIKAISYTLVKEGKPTNIKLSQNVVNEIPNYFLNSSKFDETLTQILHASCETYEKNSSKIPKRQSNANKYRLKYFRTFLLDISNAVLNHYVGNVNARVHFRRLNGDIYEGLVVTEGVNQKVFPAKQLTAMPSKSGMIFVSGNLSLPLIRSLNKTLHNAGVHNDYWVEHLTCTFREQAGEQTPLLSMGISLNQQTVRRHKNTLYLMAYTRIDLIIEQCIRDYVAFCKKVDDGYDIYSFITADFE